ncbi:MAG TPA: protein kinase, partial [Minicystis sp.]|nr:protein kinase [Minicystis sp.]
MALERPTASAATRLGKYELIKEQAGSGVASTWIARVNDDTSRLLSVLRVHRHVIKKTEHVEAFLEDAKRAQPLKHENVVPFVDLGVNDGEVFVVLEHVEGELLSQLVSLSGAAGLPQPIALRIARDALEGLAAGPEAGVPHGEFGPHQVRVGLDGKGRVAGFGVAGALARMGPHGVKNHDRLAYAAPERVKSMAAPLAGGGVAADAKSDVFSAGVLLWELLAKQRLFASKIEAAVIQKVLTAPVSPLASVAGAQVPASLDEAVQKALSRDPAQRPAGVRELIEAIDASGAEIAPREDVAELVEKLAGKTIAARKQELESAAGAPKTNGVAHDGANGASPQPEPRPAASGRDAAAPVKVTNRKATLMGFAPAKPEAPEHVLAPGPSGRNAPADAKSPVADPKPAAEEAKPPVAAAPRAPMISTLDDEWVNTVDTGDTVVTGDQVSTAAAAAGAKRPPPPVPRKTAATMLGIPPLGQHEEPAS